jgi:hypothetical protein
MEKNSDPGFGMETIQIQDKHPGFATLFTSIVDDVPSFKLLTEYFTRPLSFNQSLPIPYVTPVPGPMSLW